PADGLALRHGRGAKADQAVGVHLRNSTSLKRKRRYLRSRFRLVEDKVPSLALQACKRTPAARAKKQRPHLCLGTDENPCLGGGCRLRAQRPTGEYRVHRRE